MKKHRAIVFAWAIANLALFIISFILCAQRKNVSQFFFIYGILSWAMMILLAFLLPSTTYFAIYNLQLGAFTRFFEATAPIKLQCFEILVPVSCEDCKDFQSDPEIQGKYRKMIQDKYRKIIQCHSNDDASAS